MTENIEHTKDSKNTVAAAVRADNAERFLAVTRGVLVAGVMCLCELVSAPLVNSLAGGAFTLLPWASVACLLSVAFVLILGFAFLWLAESLSRNFSGRATPVCYGLVGMISYGIWGGLVFPAIINSILRPAGLTEISGMGNWMITLNCLIIGMVSYSLAYIFAPSMAKKRGGVIAIGVVVVAAALLGAFFLWQFYARLY
ncbi:4-hydroxybenzoate polyprenyltransferase [Bifidobacterium simiarum]|nr:4-hydroxybenzoate polyprenyltransferase [Bifidobacterium simiarum]